MNTDIELKIIITNLLNEFNSRNYELVINKSKELISNDCKIPIIYNLLGASYSFISKHLEAIDAYQCALKLDTNSEEVLRNLGKSYGKLGDDKKAYDCFEKASKIKLNNSDAFFGMGLLDLKKNKFKESISKFNLAIEYNKNFYQAYYNLAIAQNYVGNLLEAQNNYLAAIKINRNYYQAYNNLGSILIKKKQTDDAIKILKKAIEIKPDYIQALTNLGIASLDKKKYVDALEYLNQVLVKDPFSVRAITQKLYILRKICDWTEDNFLEKNLNLINESNIDVTPWQLLSLDDDPEVEYIRAKKYGDQFGFQDFKLTYNHSKIKLAYFTSDFYQHAGMINMEGIFKYYDKNKFEIYAFDYGRLHNDEMHKKIKKYFDHFFYIDNLSNEEIVKIIKENEIDIAIHRNGYSQNSRNSLFSKKIAPLQISFLGYPGTMGVKFIDYIIGDKTVIPEENIKFFSEKVIFMPNTYYPTNNERVISKTKFNKIDLGIDKEAFVFGSFNNSYKISPSEFTIWMKLLASVDNSNLILLVNDDLTKKNLIKEIIKRNQDVNRVKFLNFINPAEHLARHQLIDLYLDTFNYNGHTSAVDSLYAGIPIVTKIGNSFTSRVCASILKAIDMPDLIVSNEIEYFDLAYKIAKNNNIYNQIKLNLKNNLETTALFNTRRYVKDLERGYELALKNKKNYNKIDHIEL